MNHLGSAKLSKHHFAKFLSKRAKFLYIEAPINITLFVTRPKESIELFRRAITSSVKIKENFWLSSFLYLIPFRGSKYLFGSSIVNWINQRIIIKKFNRQIKNLK